MSTRTAQLISRLTRGLGVTEAEAIGLWSRVAPIILLDNLDDDFSSDVFQARKCVNRNFEAADAIELSGVGIRNPAGSGVNVIIEKILVAFATTIAVRGSFLALAGAGLTIGTAVNGQYRDRRRAGNAAAQVISYTTPGAIGTIFWQSRVVSNRSPEYGLDLLIPPGGDQVLFTNQTVNLGADATLFWTEIPVQPSG